MIVQIFVVRSQCFLVSIGLGAGYWCYWNKKIGKQKERGHFLKAVWRGAMGNIRKHQEIRDNKRLTFLVVNFSYSPFLHYLFAWVKDVFSWLQTWMIQAKAASYYQLERSWDQTIIRKSIKNTSATQNKATNTYNTITEIKHTKNNNKRITPQNT